MCLEEFTIYISREKFEPDPGFKSGDPRFESRFRFKFFSWNLNKCFGIELECGKITLRDGSTSEGKQIRKVREEEDC